MGHPAGASGNPTRRKHESTQARKRRTKAKSDLLVAILVEVDLELLPELRRLRVLRHDRKVGLDGVPVYTRIQRSSKRQMRTAVDNEACGCVAAWLETFPTGWIGWLVEWPEIRRRCVRVLASDCALCVEFVVLHAAQKLVGTRCSWWSKRQVGEGQWGRNEGVKEELTASSLPLPSVSISSYSLPPDPTHHRPQIERVCWCGNGGWLGRRRRHPQRRARRGQPAGGAPSLLPLSPFSCLLQRGNTQAHRHEPMNTQARVYFFSCASESELR